MLVESWIFCCFAFWRHRIYMFLRSGQMHARWEDSEFLLAWDRVGIPNITASPCLIAPLLVLLLLVILKLVVSRASRRGGVRQSGMKHRTKQQIEFLASLRPKRNPSGKQSHGVCTPYVTRLKALNLVWYWCTKLGFHGGMYQIPSKSVTRTDLISGWLHLVQTYSTFLYLSRNPR